MAKMFAKNAKTFAKLSMTIIVTRRRPVLILHLEAKYAKMDCKNKIYAKNWTMSTWIAKSQRSKSTLSQSQLWSMVKSMSWSTMTSTSAWQMTSADVVADDVNR